MEDFEKIYSEYFDMVYGYCLRLSHDPSLAEEVTQVAPMPSAAVMEQIIAALS